MYDGGFKGPGFDWNGNNKKDGFDVFMDMKAVEDANKYSKANHYTGSTSKTYQKNIKYEDATWGQVGVIWLAVAILFFAFFLVFTVFSEFPLICCAICFGAIFLAIKIINGK